jgi:hypothetical protein
LKDWLTLLPIKNSCKAKRCLMPITSLRNPSFAG